MKRWCKLTRMNRSKQLKRSDALRFLLWVRITKIPRLYDENTWKHMEVFSNGWHVPQRSVLQRPGSSLRDLSELWHPEVFWCLRPPSWNLFIYVRYVANLAQIRHIHTYSDISMSFITLTCYMPFLTMILFFVVHNSMIVPLRSSVPKSRLNAFLLRGNAALRPRGGTWFNHVQPEGTFRRTWQRLRARLKFATSGWWKIELYIQRPCVFADLFFQRCAIGRDNHMSIAPHRTSCLSQFIEAMQKIPLHQRKW